MRTSTYVSNFLLFVAASLAGCGHSQDPADASGAALGSPVGLALSPTGMVKLDRSALGSRQYDLVDTATYAAWDDKNCVGLPAGYRPQPPPDAPDTCFYKVIPLATRVAVFSLVGSEVVLTEFGAGELARFAVAASDAQTISFVFDPASVKIKLGLYKDRATFDDVTIPLVDRRVRGNVAEGFASIRQDATFTLPTGPAPGRLQYGLRLHRDNPQFRPAVEASNAKWFYEINDPSRSIAKYDVSGNKVIKLANVGIPAQYGPVGEEALKIAVDYWNRVFRAASGQKDHVFFESVSAPTGVFMHEPGYSLVSWMTFEGNSSSNGRFQTDAKTGEIFFGNALISAGFFPVARNVGARFYEHVNGGAAPAATVDRFAVDYITETVAHEIGHTLGLQHDFQASNIALGHTPADLEAIAKAYFAGGTPPADLSASTMEYLPLPIAGMLGNRMRTEVLPHDVRAIARAYFGTEIDLKKLFDPALAERVVNLGYCNDEDTVEPDPSKPGGCKTFDHPLCAVGDAYCWTTDL